MAKNFTDFTLGAPTTAHFLVGYDVDAVDGEKQYTIESILTKTEPYHVSLENVTNESKTTMFTDPVFTGSASAYDLVVEGDLRVEGSTTTVDTTIEATSAMQITNTGTGPALIVEQTGTEPIVRFLDDGAEVLEVIDGGNVGIGGPGPTDVKCSVYGNLSAMGEIYVGGQVDGRDLHTDGAKLDNIENNAKDDQTGAEIKSLYEGEANAFTDAHFTKLAGIAEGANNTYASLTAINDIADGPWTGSKDTTYVKMTSAQAEGSINLDKGIDSVTVTVAGDNATRAELVTTIAAVRNIDGNTGALADGHAHLSDTNITTSLTAQNAKLGTNVYVVSSGNFSTSSGQAGHSGIVDVGGTQLHFQDGILIGVWT